jgi:hypothetical protein
LKAVAERGGADVAQQGARSTAAVLGLLVELAETGRWGAVAVGSPWEQVTAQLGEPWDYAIPSGRRSRPTLFAYGDLELSICGCRKLAMIHVQTWRDVIELPHLSGCGPGDAVGPDVSRGRGDGTTYPSAISEQDVIDALDRGGCPWEPYPALTFGDQRSLRAGPAGATFTFALWDEQDGWLLNIAGVTGERHTCADR